MENWTQFAEFLKSQGWQQEQSDENEMVLIEPKTKSVILISSEGELKFFERMKPEDQLVDTILIKIEAPKNEYARKLLASSLTLIHPMTVVRNDQNYLSFKLYDCGNMKKVDDKLDYLCEASGIDFKYTTTILAPVRRG